MALLDDLLQRIKSLPEDERAKLEALKAQTAPVWIPNPGPQTEALHCEADELFYGGQAGGGKSDLLIGLSLTEHYESLILRRVNKDAKDLAKRARSVAGDAEESFNGQDLLLKLADGREIEFGGCQFEDDKERRKGRAKDFYGFDEIGDFTESQYKFITTWNRSSREGQRCRVVCAGNPPTRPEGLWIIQYWAAWLDPLHPNPAKPGELRWYIRGENDEDVEVDGRGPHSVPWHPKPVLAKSRTFLPARLEDNPDYARTDYAAMLDSLPAALRSAYRDGNFEAGLKDADFQVIPTAWIEAAQERWTPDGWKDFAMTAMALDPAGGGRDDQALCWRHGGWYAPIETKQGAETADGSNAAASVIKHRRDNAPVVVDVGGGYGGAVALRLKDNSILHAPFNGANATTAKTQDGQLAFANKRAEAWWRMREGLDPDQQGGSVVCLPPDNELKADLAAPTYEVTARGILIESKDDLRKRLGRSPGKGDTAVMCLSAGNAARRSLLANTQGLPKVQQAYSTVKRRRP